MRSLVAIIGQIGQSREVFRVGKTITHMATGRDVAITEVEADAQGRAFVSFADGSRTMIPNAVLHYEPQDDIPAAVDRPGEQATEAPAADRTRANMPAVANTQAGQEPDGAVNHGGANSRGRKPRRDR